MNNDKVHVFLGILQGIVETIEVYQDKEGARQAFEGFTGVTFEEFCSRSQKESYGEILGEGYKDCRVYKLTVR